MSHLRRAIGCAVAAVVLLAALAPTAAYRAQPPDTVTVDGSALVAPILEAARTTYAARNPDAQIAIEVSGTSGGLELLCEGSLDVAMAYGAITDSQIAACQASGVAFVEVLLGYDALVALVNPAAPAACLSVDQFSTLLGPAGADVGSWQSIDPTLEDSPISGVFGPPDVADYATRFRLERLISGDGLRDDIEALETAQAVAERVRSEVTAVGLMTLAAYSQINPEQVPTRPLQLRANDVCIEATVPDLDEARYPAAESLYVYVNAESLERESVSGFLSYLLSADGRRAVRTANYTLATAILYDRGASYLTEGRTGRTFSRIQTVDVPANVQGVVNLNGSSVVFPLVRSLNDTFTPRYSGVTINATGFGNEVGYRALCSDAVDMIGATRLATEAEAEACQAAGIQTLVVPIGYKAMTVLVSAENTFAQCFSLDDVRTIFSAATSPTRWSDVDPDFPELELLTITPRSGAIDTDFVLARVAGEDIAPVRRQDAVENDSAQYRATATQNVAGGVTFIPFADFEQTTAAVRAVAIDAGNGCVAPSAESIADGSYALATPLYLVFNLNSFARPEIRAYVWYVLSEDALASLNRQSLTGLDAALFVEMRDLVLERFAQAEQAAATPEPTPEPTPADEATPEPTPADEATPEPTPADEATPEPTATQAP
jgi:phosphate transport system substrate-binding protein